MVGTTTDGKRVIGGIFPMVNSEGILLEIIVSKLNEQGDVVDWFGFWQDSMKHGWNPRSTVSKITSVIGEEFGSRVREQHEKSLFFLRDFEIAKRNNNEPEMLRLLRKRQQDELSDQKHTRV